VSQHVETFLASLKRCLGADAFLQEFYTLFTDSSEEVREKFSNTDPVRQARILGESLYALAVAAQGLDGSPARADFERLAARHGRHGLDIRPELYDLWLECLVRTARAHDPFFSPETEAAWRAALGQGIEYLRSRR
jgi:hemoglobin-like flavoprotein